VLPYDWLKKHGVSFRDINVRYMGNTPEAVEAFKAGALDMICTIEPYGTALLHDVKGSVMLSDGTDIYGKGYTDCVLAARSELIATSPAAIKTLIKGMMKAQHMAESDPEAVLKILVGPYYKTSIENARIAMAKQPSVVDARSQTQFILDRTNSILEMGYIKNKPGRDAIDWTILEQAAYLESHSLPCRLYDLDRQTESLSHDSLNRRRVPRYRNCFHNESDVSSLSTSLDSQHGLSFDVVVLASPW